MTAETVPSASPSGVALPAPPSGLGAGCAGSKGCKSGSLQSLTGLGSAGLGTQLAPLTLPASAGAMAPRTVNPPPSPQPHYDSECARMEAWLDEHPDFVHDYFLR